VEDCDPGHPCPVNCEAHWGEWSDCDAKCGAEDRTASRAVLGSQTRPYIITQHGRYGGDACPTDDCLAHRGVGEGSTPMSEEVVVAPCPNDDLGLPTRPCNIACQPGLPELPDNLFLLFSSLSFSFNDISDVDKDCLRHEQSDYPTNCSSLSGSNYLGCNNYICEEHNNNNYDNWTIKIDSEDEMFHMCNNSPDYSYASTMNTGERCNKEVCCENDICGNKMDEPCPEGSYIIYNKKCYGNCTGDNGIQYCCSAPIKPTIHELYRNILLFAKKYNPELTELRGKDIRNFIFNTLLDIEKMKNQGVLTISDEKDINNLTEEDYEDINTDIDKIEDINIHLIELKGDFNEDIINNNNLYTRSHLDIINRFKNTLNIEPDSNITISNIKQSIKKLNQIDKFDMTPVDAFSISLHNEGNEKTINPTLFQFML